MSKAFPLDVCENCYFLRDGAGAWYECCFSSPTPNLLPMANTYAWPRVRLDDWCGDGINYTTAIKYHKAPVEKS